mgnify:CR=1 FL=1|tara:strand:- start:5018 stop:5563 length:546 start_codon:yes stop_codon:yes gene_type:complete
MTDYAKFRTLPLPCIVVPQVNEGARNQALKSIGAGLATSSEVASYLRISGRSLPMLLAEGKLKCNRAGRFAWADIWRDLWQIPDVPPSQYGRMKASLLTTVEVAQRAGVSDRSILRDGKRKTSLYGLPRHLQLSTRLRRYHPAMIFLWETGESLEDWMRPVRTKSTQRRGLRVVNGALKPP